MSSANIVSDTFTVVRREVFDVVDSETGEAVTTFSGGEEAEAYREALRLTQWRRDARSQPTTGETP